MDLRFSGRESGHTDGPVANLNKRQVQPVTPEETMILRNVHNGFPLAERAGGHHDFGEWLRRMGRLHRTANQNEKRQKFVFHCTLTGTIAIERS
jgi:hypothetical protein